MKILLIGQCTLHWGRMEFGNIGNFYIIESLIRELHSTFPDAAISTTFQMSESFCKKERINVLPMSLYYSWSDKDLETALIELASAQLFHDTGHLPQRTPFIEAVLDNDLVIDFSGDIWGDNADFLGKDRFLVGLIKDRVAQLLGKKTAMIAGSPGPFNNEQTTAFAREVFKNFDLVTNREAISKGVLEAKGFDIKSIHSLACPAFLFEPAKGEITDTLINKELGKNRDSPVVGFILCGWNFLEGPFDKWPRDDKDYIPFAEAVEHLERLGATVCLMSHSNGFIPGKEPFELIHGRDYPVTKQLESVLHQRGIAKKIFVLNGVYDAWITKAIISNFDMLVSGRIHAAVAGLSQYIPTVIIDYGHEPKAHKLKGFADVAGMLDYVADPGLKDDLIAKIDQCWTNRETINSFLLGKIPTVKEMAKQNFILLQKLFVKEVQP
ncbi:polysaccharide pyruvyl transferase family protein [Agriterribacter sp.]|uniref:polysaccharide pyruvyl transferase family protein n=1 Tax=Agriterribacter sp. TaxID=2821509 RepID=UPI002BF09F9B|nr:polysaccharide pyruvyl transferase family protein [Agriterribacter sp.]HRP58355.1 polysaccharide pyruvyl transferase family protein [Agriterribacter sp.]